MACGLTTLSLAIAPLLAPLPASLPASLPCAYHTCCSASQRATSMGALSGADGLVYRQERRTARPAAPRANKFSKMLAKRYAKK